MGMSKLFALPVLSLGLLTAASGQAASAKAGSGRAAEGPWLSYFGRSSVKIRTASGFVVYIDPYAPGDYSEPADLILVTHGHSDHNAVGLPARKEGCVVAAPRNAVDERGYRVLAEGMSLTEGPLTVRVLPAANRNHPRGECLGYLLSFDNIVLYHAGDTSWLPEMEGFASFGIGYALLPCDGYYNMGPEEAEKCAAAIRAKRVLPMHSSKDGDFGQKNAEALAALATAAGAKGIALKPGERLALLP
jgi:L-ascorbate metabolism protein UlaG (beta-lactamase superfamily)